VWSRRDPASRGFDVPVTGRLLLGLRGVPVPRCIGWAARTRTLVSKKLPGVRHIATSWTANSVVWSGVGSSMAYSTLITGKGRYDRGCAVRKKGQRPRGNLCFKPLGLERAQRRTSLSWVYGDAAGLSLVMVGYTERLFHQETDVGFFLVAGTRVKSARRQGALFGGPAEGECDQCAGARTATLVVMVTWVSGACQ
jgi:hypothetical protein